MHDFDNNTKLDGLEILKALTHLLPYEEDEQNKVDVRGKSADDIAREKRDKELLYYAGDLQAHLVCSEPVVWVTGTSSGLKKSRFGYPQMSSSGKLDSMR